MFKNRAVQVTLTKNDTKTPNEHRAIDRDDVVYWNAVIISNLQTLGGGLIFLYGLKKMIDTGSAMMIKMTPSR